MMDLFTLVRQTQKSLDEPDLVFLEESQRLMGYLRSKGILPVNRTTVNGDLHYLFSATLVTAHYLGTSIYVSSRNKGNYKTLSTRFIKFLDDAVTARLLESKSSKGIAESELHLSETLKSQINLVENISRKLEHWNKPQVSTFVS